MRIKMSKEQRSDAVSAVKAEAEKIRDILRYDRTEKTLSGRDFRIINNITPVSIDTYLAWETGTTWTGQEIDAAQLEMEIRWTFGGVLGDCSEEMSIPAWQTLFCQVRAKLQLFGRHALQVK